MQTRKRADDALLGDDDRAELAALRLLVRNSTDMLARHDPDGIYLWVSPACRTLLGYDPEELVGRSPYELFHPTDLAEVAQSHSDVLATPDLSTVEYRIRHADGHDVWLETTSHAVRGPDGEVQEIQTSSRDLTQRRRAEARLRESEERFRLSMENAPIGMALVTPDGRFSEVNDRLCQIVGRRPDELRRLSFQDITHPDDLEADVAQVEALLAGQRDRYSMEKRYFHADGHVVWILLSVSLVHDDDGDPLYFIAQIDDITERRRQVQELAASNAELERFAMVASHDLRSPLATTRGLLDLALTGAVGDVPAVVQDVLRRAHRSTGRQLETVDALLQLARVGRGPVVRTPVDVGQVLDDAMEGLGPRLEAAGARVVVEELPAVLADPADVRLVLQNLLANASKFGDPDRDLVITVRSERRPEGWAVVVEDTGTGFSPQDVEVMFEPFGRTADGRKVQGEGIGLATCRRIVEHHGGSITAEPLDEGARFIFVLPPVVQD